jgi:hypothetical protein
MSFDPQEKYPYESHSQTVQPSFDSERYCKAFHERQKHQSLGSVSRLQSHSRALSPYIKLVFSLL